ncbi:microtubule-associated futsch-like protein [Labeo rohita]|uniref:Microtubule-associated futsch-like protein n=1 Tax=Labeo rohita TaxID=84645 RepID=A0A498NWJ3_LABRO|nr:microtubule-associated futsch-like protein [Labeo rohita]
MQFLGNKLSEAQTQVSGWVGNMRRSLQEAVELMSGALEREEVIKEEEDEQAGRFERAISPLRSFASRGRQSLRNLSQQSRQRFSLRKRVTAANSNNVFNSPLQNICEWFYCMLSKYP